MSEHTPDPSDFAADAAPDETGPEPAQLDPVAPDGASPDALVPDAVVPDIDVPEPSIPEVDLPALAEPVIPPAPAEQAPTRASRRTPMAAKLADDPAPASDPQLTAPEPDPALVPPPTGATPSSYRGWTIAIYSALALLFGAAMTTIGMLLS